MDEVYASERSLFHVDKVVLERRGSRLLIKIYQRHLVRSKQYRDFVEEVWCLNDRDKDIEVVLVNPGDFAMSPPNAD